MPWSDAIIMDNMMSAEKLDKSTIVSRLKERDVTERIRESDVQQYASQKRRASVLVPLILCENGDLQVLLTVRAKHMRTDGGDVAFPGGKQDDDDEDEIATALREAWEEIGLYQADVEPVSQLPPMISRTGIFLNAIVGFIPEKFEPNINPNEVDDVFCVPLLHFLSSKHHNSQQTPSIGRFARLHFFKHDIDGKTFITYGLTAYLCILAACAVYHRAPEFEMETGFDHVNLAQGFLDYVERKKKEQQLTIPGGKL